MRLSDEQFNSWLENLRKEQNLTDDQKFQAALKQEGMTLQDLRRNVERSCLVSRVQQDEVGSKLTITEEEADNDQGSSGRRVLVGEVEKK